VEPVFPNSGQRSQKLAYKSYFAGLWQMTKTGILEAANVGGFQLSSRCGFLFPNLGQRSQKLSFRSICANLWADC
jgi:hypothetical protein